MAPAPPSMIEPTRGGQIDNGSGVEDLYVMDDFLPTPMEAMPNNTLPQVCAFYLSLFIVNKVYLFGPLLFTVV